MYIRLGESLLEKAWRDFSARETKQTFALLRTALYYGLLSYVSALANFGWRAENGDFSVRSKKSHENGALIISRKSVFCNLYGKKAAEIVYRI